ncbi:MAG: hypothetical protein M1834_006239 [Cirrosporium novae-zelandiae]|nr:MAG: hypothetical protein M1834_006239 [Cirrosporium novae-zelandiae]
MASETRQKTAIISVYNKTGLLDLAKGLSAHKIRILASGGTARLIREGGFECEDVSAVTHSPEILSGRVKTLHPAVHAGILARNLASDEKDLAEQNINKVDYVVCNLYPFKDTIAKINVTIPEAVEEIDIGGVTLIRAAAKNHARVTILTDPEDYPEFLKELEKGEVAEKSKKLYALKAFEHTADYDSEIAAFFRKKYASNGIQHLALRYGANPHQKSASACIKHGQLPFKVLNGSPGYINLLDSLNAWPLVKELKAALGLPAAASFKHVSPAGAAVGVPLNEKERKVYMVDDIDGLADSPLAQAYARARGADRMSSFGDIIALSDEVDIPTAKIISREVSDGVIAPAYDPEALKILSKKKGGKYLVLQMDETYEPPSQEARTVYGIHLSQHRNDAEITPDSSFNSIIRPKNSPPLPSSALRDLTVATLALKYTQSNSVCYALQGQLIGLGAGQQSRIHCTRLAGDKADNWWMRFHDRTLGIKWKKGTKRPEKSNAIDLLCSDQLPKDGPEREDYEQKFEIVPEKFSDEERAAWLSKLTNVAVASDAFFPFTDNVFRAARSGAKYIAAPTGSQNDQPVFETAEKLGITFVENPILIKVGGSPRLKAVIGRAREPEAGAELELMSSTSSDICELWNGVGIVRVVGTPSMLELIYRSGANVGVADGSSSAEVHTLDTVKASGVYALKSCGNDSEKGSADNYDSESGESLRGSKLGPYSNQLRPPPNLFLNISGGTVSNWELVLVAMVGAFLQLGVFVYDGLITVPSKARLNSSSSPYTLPFTIAGTLGMISGAYICAHVVETSTDEEVWEAVGPGKYSLQTVWLQRGQTVGDQVFRSFAIYNTLNQQVIRTSRKTSNLKRLEGWALLGSALSVISFVLQFIGLRAMHWSACIAQLLVTGVMVVLRAVIRRKLSMVPKVQPLPAGFELDIMAKNINGCQNWKILATPSFDFCPGKCSVNISCLASRILHTRIRLTELSGWPGEFSKTVDQLTWTIQAAMDHFFKTKGDIVIKNLFQQSVEFVWSLPVLILRTSTEEEGELKIILKRMKVDNKWSPWQIRQEEIEAVLSLWMSHFLRFLTPVAAPKLWILGPNSTFHRIIYDWWIYRRTQKVQFDNIQNGCIDSNVDERRLFDLQGSRVNLKGPTEGTNGLLGIVTNASLQETCGQYLLAYFLKNVMRIIDRLEGTTHINPGSSLNQFTLVSDSIRGIAETLQQNGLVSAEDSYRLLIPPLSDADMLQDPFDILEDIVTACKAQMDTADPSTEQSSSENTFWRLVYLCNRKAKLLSCEGRWADAGRTSIQLINVRSNALDSHDNSTLQAQQAMRQFADEFVRSSISTGSEHKMRQKNIDEPFRLHVAAARGYLDLVFEALEDGVGVDTWDDEHETPISLTIKNVDRETLYDAVDENGRSSYPQGDKMVTILLLNLVDKTELLHEASEKAYDVAARNGSVEVVKILIYHGADVAAKAPNGRTALHPAVENGRLQITSLLVEAGADLSARDELRQTPLHVAALAGSTDTARLLFILLQLKAKDNDQSTALHLAARNRAERVIALLSEDRANLVARDKYGQDPLTVAAREDGRESVIRIMVERGADMHSRDVSGRGALEYAAQRGHEAVMRLLVEKGVPPDSKDGFGRTALHYASMGGHVATIRFLVKKVANTNAVDKDGWTSLHYTSRTGHMEVE